jgi:hypothetical protein
MKTFREYLTETKKVYSFKVKLAGEVPENFVENLKKGLEKYQIVALEKMATPVEETSVEFKQHGDKEITVFDLVVEYPITAPEIAAHLKEMNIGEERFRVRGSMEPSEYDTRIVSTEAGALLDDPHYSEESKIKYRDYFGDDFNKDFLKQLAKEAKERKKELGQDKGDPDVLGSTPKLKTDKAGVKSAIGS